MGRSLRCTIQPKPERIVDKGRCIFVRLLDNTCLRSAGDDPQIGIGNPFIHGNWHFDRIQWIAITKDNERFCPDFRQFWWLGIVMLYKVRQLIEQRTNLADPLDMVMLLPC